MNAWCAGFAAAALIPGPLAAQGLHYEGGLSVSTGRYIFAERTTTWALSAGLAAGIGRVTLRATLPAYLQNTSLIAASPIGHMPTGGSSSGVVADSGAARKGRHGGTGPMMSSATMHVDVPSSAAAGFQSALGDPTFSLAVRTLDGARGQFTIGAAAKAPIADTATFGTGEWDLGATAALSWLPSMSTILSLDVAYWHLGDFDDLDFRDPLYGTVSLGYIGRRGWAGSAFASAGTAAIEGFDGPVSLGAALTRLAGGTAWSLAASVGLTETTPDLTVGLSWRVRLIQ